MSKLAWHSLDKSETNLLKGVGIFLIISHNFFHAVHPIAPENQFFFQKSNQNLRYSLFDPQRQKKTLSFTPGDR